MNDKRKESPEEWVSEEAKRLHSEHLEKHPRSLFQDENDLNIWSDRYTMGEAAAIVVSITSEEYVRDENGDYVERFEVAPCYDDVHPDSISADVMVEFALDSSRYVAIWCAKWVAQYIGKEQAQEMYDAWDLGGSPHHTGWEPE